VLGIDSVNTSVFAPSSLKATEHYLLAGSSSAGVLARSDQATRRCARYWWALNGDVNAPTREGHATLTALIDPKNLRHVVPERSTSWEPQPERKHVWGWWQIRHVPPPGGNFEEKVDIEEHGRWRMASSGMLRRVAYVRTDVSEELSASLIWVTRIGELGTTLVVTSTRRPLWILSPWWRRR
jgi:hypothetical protein